MRPAVLQTVINGRVAPITAESLPAVEDELIMAATFACLVAADLGAADLGAADLGAA
jgi:hypothetical protein